MDNLIVLQWHHLQHEVLILKLIFGVPLDLPEEIFGEGNQVEIVHNLLRGSR